MIQNNNTVEKPQWDHNYCSLNYPTAQLWGTALLSLFLGSVYTESGFLFMFYNVVMGAIFFVVV